MERVILFNGMIFESVLFLFDVSTCICVCVCVQATALPLLVSTYMCTYINNKCFKSIAFDGASVAVAVAIVQAFTNLSLLLYPCRVKIFASPNVAVFLIFVVATTVAAAAFVAILHDNIPTIQCYSYRNILRRSFFLLFHDATTHSLFHHPSSSYSGTFVSAHIQNIHNKLFIFHFPISNCIAYVPRL